MGQNRSDCKTKCSDLYDDTVNTINACIKEHNGDQNNLNLKETNIDNLDYEEGNNERKNDYYSEDNNIRNQ